MKYCNLSRIGYCFIKYIWNSHHSTHILPPAFKPGKYVENNDVRIVNMAWLVFTFTGSIEKVANRIICFPKNLI